ncbi:hypothetical protein WJX84_008319 [Apatococcus fuscideae]|uniref:C2H2-type domain-containing protein n=1 Tax=Apatococcus fuscideae TaxID=2026836 RepID=A0AAW1SD48_9CHLO
MGVGQRSTGKGGKVRRITKTKRRATFLERHIDQIWEDVQQPEGVHDGKTAPLGTTDSVQLDADLPACGRHYCQPCSRFFVSEHAQTAHEQTKSHKNRVKDLMGPRPHSNRDAELAGNMGAPDNGPKLRPHVAVPAPMAIS